MAQVIQALCDVHLHAEDEKQLVGRTFVININGRIRVTELCGACEEQLLTELQRVLDEYGRKADATDMPAPAREPRISKGDKGDKTVTCPKDNEVFKTRAGLAIHARAKHEMSVEAVLGEAPHLGLYSCTFPDCGAKSVSRGAVSTHALNRHQLTISELEGMYGLVVPSLGDDLSEPIPEGDDGQYICLDCTPPRKFNMAAGLHSHRRNKHKDRVAA